MVPERKNTHLKDFDYSTTAYAYFVTICCLNKNPYFKEEALSSIVTESLAFMDDPGRSAIHCYCLMPDHLHVALSLRGGKDLNSWVTSFKRFTSNKAKKDQAIQGLWQKNYYEHVIRDYEALGEICAYVLDNPVRKGLVSRREDYPLSFLGNLPG